MPQDPSGFGIFTTVNGKVAVRKKYTNPVDPTFFFKRLMKCEGLPYKQQLRCK